MSKNYDPFHYLSLVFFGSDIRVSTRRFCGLYPCTIIGVAMGDKSTVEISDAWMTWMDPHQQTVYHEAFLLPSPFHQQIWGVHSHQLFPYSSDLMSQNSKVSYIFFWKDLCKIYLQWPWLISSFYLIPFLPQIICNNSSFNHCCLPEFILSLPYSPDWIMIPGFNPVHNLCHYALLWFTTWHSKGVSKKGHCLLKTEYIHSNEGLDASYFSPWENMYHYISPAAELVDYNSSLIDVCDSHLYSWHYYIYYINTVEFCIHIPFILSNILIRYSVSCCSFRTYIIIHIISHSIYFNIQAYAIWEGGFNTFSTHSTFST